MSEKINVEKVERELMSALAADRKYSRENDAKIRAITQRVGSYDEFREMVKGSHLRPLDKKDTKGSGGYRQPWNPAAGGGKETEEENEKEVDLHEKGVMNLQSFLRQWKKSSPTPPDQYRFLLNMDKEDLSHLFKVEISMGLLGEILIVLNKQFIEEDKEKVFGVLEVLSSSLRFKLSLDFLSKTEKTAKEELFEKLSLSCKSQEDSSSLHSLIALYSH